MNNFKIKMGISTSSHKVPKLCEVSYSNTWICKDSIKFFRNERDHTQIKKLDLSVISNDELIDENNWTNALCTVNGLRVYDDKVRKASIFNKELFTDSDDLYCFMISNALKYTNGNNKIELIRYKEGEFTSKHIDRIGDFTCLIFPKNQKFTGGELILYEEGKPKKITKFNPENSNFVTMVIFPTGLMHEVLPVTSGVRYVYKISLSMKNKSECMIVFPDSIFSFKTNCDDVKMD